MAPMEGMYWLNGKQNPELPPLQKHSRKTFPSCLWKICIRVKVMQEDLAIFLLTLKYIYKFKRSSCMMGWTTPDDDRDWEFALVGVNMVSSGLRTLVAGLSNLESGDWHPKVLGLKNMDVTFVLWKTDTPIWWLVGFRLETGSPQAVLGSSCQWVLYWGCCQAFRDPGRWWLFAVNTTSYFYAWGKPRSNYQRDNTVQGGIYFSYNCFRSLGRTMTNWPETTASWGLEGIAPSLPSHWRKQRVSGIMNNFLNDIANYGWLVD